MVGQKNWSVGIIGLGRIGLGYDLEHDAERYINTHCRAFASHPNFRLIGGMDPDTDRRLLLDRRCNVSGYPDLAGLLTHETPDVLVVASPTQSHVRVVEESLAYCRPRVILCEKLLAYQLADSRRIVSACEDAYINPTPTPLRNQDEGILDHSRRYRIAIVALRHQTSQTGHTSSRYHPRGRRKMRQVYHQCLQQLYHSHQFLGLLLCEFGADDLEQVCTAFRKVWAQLGTLAEAPRN